MAGLDIDPILERARQFHKDHPMDAAHDLRHHEAVWENGLLIVKEEGLEGECDLPVLEVAMMLHDAIDGKRGEEEVKENTTYVRQLILNGGGGSDFADKVIAIIKVHSFNEDQGESVEAKILYDADKLEYVSKSRFQIALAAKKSGKMSQEKLEEYGSMWRARIGGVGDSLHFESSKRRFDEMLGELLEYIKNEAPEYQSWLDGVV